MHHMEIYNEGLSDVALYIKKNKRTNLEERGKIPVYY